MFRKMTLVALALALMTTLAAPVAWGQASRAIVDPDGQPATSSATLTSSGDLDLGLASPGTAASRLAPYDVPQETGQNKGDMLFELLYQFLQQLL